MHPRRLALLLLAACATLAHAQKAPDDCGNAPFAACCFGNHTDAPADLPTNQFIYYVWVCEIMCQQVP